MTCPFVGRSPRAEVGPTPRAVRWLYVPLGLSCFAMAVAGALLPGLPTTVFVLLGSFFLTRSCPWLERRMMASRLMRPYAKYLDPATPFPTRARWFAAGAMWTSIGASVAVLSLADSAPVWFIPMMILAGVIGSVCIARFRRRATASASA